MIIATGAMIPTLDFDGCHNSDGDNNDKAKIVIMITSDNDHRVLVAW